MPDRKLFVYGTLMHPPVFEAVTGRMPGAMNPAQLQGYRRGSIAGVAFPGIVPQEGASTNGLLVDLDENELALLDAFEGSWYERKLVEVKSADGRKIRADVYVLAEELYDRLLEESWDLEKFLATDLHSFLNGGS